MRIGGVGVQEKRFVAMAFEPWEHYFVQRRGIGPAVRRVYPVALDHGKLHHVVEAALQSGNLSGPRAGGNVRGDIPGIAELFRQRGRTLGDGVVIVENPVRVGIDRSEQRGYRRLSPGGLRLAIVEDDTRRGQFLQERRSIALVSIQAGVVRTQCIDHVDQNIRARSWAGVC